MKAFIAIVAFLVLQSGRPISIVQREPDAYEGTWHYQNSNKLFIVKIWIEDNDYKGYYKMVNYNNGTIGSTIYTSGIDYGNGRFYLPFSISGNFVNGSGLVGFVYDNTISGYDDFKTGNLQIQINGQNTANWKVTEVKGLKPDSEPSFNIPLNIILTKVSNTVTLD